MGKIRIILDVEENDFGPIWRLVTEGKVNIRHTRPLDETGDADEFIKKTRQEQAGRGSSNGKHHHRVDGLRTIECAVAIMQRKPDEVWDTQEVGICLEEFEYDRHNASGVMTCLVDNLYVQRIAPGKYVLTDLGKKHDQSKMLPFGLKR